MPLHGLERAGEMWLAEAIWDSGFVLFDGDGAFASELVTLGMLDRATVSAELIFVGTLDTDGVKARAHDLFGAPLGPSMLLSADEADGLAIGAVGETALAVWSTATRIAARAFTETSTSPVVFELETGVLKDSFHAALVGTGQDELAIAWSERRAADSHYRVFFMRAQADGVRGLPRMLADSLEPKRVVALERTRTGLVLLVEHAGHPLVVQLTTFGDPIGPAYHFLGMSRAHGLAVHEDGRMLLAGLRMDGRNVVRELDPSGAPIGEPLCLDETPSYGEHAVGVAPSAKGYAVLHRTAAGEERLFPFESTAKEEVMPLGEADGGSDHLLGAMR